MNGSSIHSKIDNWFKLTERGTTVKIEAAAGITTFMTMVFLISVHPAIMASAGMDQGAMATLTIVSAAIFTLICGLSCNIPFAMATGMGANAIIAYSIVGAGIASWQVALGMNFIAGIVFVLIGIFNLQDVIVKIIPKGVKLTMCARSRFLAKILILFGKNFPKTNWKDGGKKISFFYPHHTLFFAVIHSIVILIRWTAYTTLMFAWMWYICRGIIQIRCGLLWCKIWSSCIPIILLSHNKILLIIKILLATLLFLLQSTYCMLL